jgi:hypothetical protein|tara:strand:+ start:62 stop:493 length:432 start_codon:yes stop_codon:yes gene_type:complete
MVTFRNNNNRRNSFRRNSRSFKSNGDRTKFSPSFSNNENFQRKNPGRNNHNASKLIEKYNNLAREALSIGDKILSENYFQHADHFTRIQVENDNYKKNKLSQNDDKNLVSTEEVSKISGDNDKKDNFSENDNIKADKILSEAN